MDDIERLQKIFDESKRIVFFTGAGASTESGIPDFRSVDGLYNTKYAYPPETIISHTFFYENTKEFYRFYKDKMIYPSALPNKAHLKMAEYEKIGKCRGIITQNIDGLHQMAGSKNVYELHGSIHRNYCQRCHKFYDVKKIIDSIDVPYCDCGGLIKPDVVLYEEGLNDKILHDAIEQIRLADTLVIVGTSLVVYPAAGLINYFRGKNLVLINKSETPADKYASLAIHQACGEVLDKIICR